MLGATITSGQESSVRWHDASELALEGRGWTDTKRPYARLPAKAEALVRRPVWDLAQHSAGFNVRFVTDATTISARWTLLNNRLEMPHMPATGVSGVDLYVRDEGLWKYLATGRPTRFPDNESVLVRGLEKAEREYRLYFPLYNGVERVEIGVHEGATFKPAPPLRATLRPIVFYGTSITQGGCASRPGMAYPAILGRTLGVPVINLGFSGNGKTEPEMAALLAEINAAAFVLDSLPNLTTAEVSERLPGFIDTIRERHKTVPIVLVESIAYTDKPFVGSRNERFMGSNDALRRIYNERRAAGDGRVYYVPSHNLIGLDGEGTVDGVHPTDLGFQRMASELEMHLRLIPRLIPPAPKLDPAEDQFKPLFDGQTLSGWERLDTIPMEHVGGKWRVENGILIGDQDPPGRGGFLATKETFRDFVLRLEAQQDYPTDTGIFARVAEDGKSHQLTLDYRPLGEMGAIFMPWTQGRVLRNPEGVHVYKVGEWNDVQVRVEGEPARLRMWLNGSLITDFQHTAESTKGVPPQGRIALPVHPDVPNLTTWKPGNTVRYRHIRILRLNAR